jgi:SAM-dependent methyltransferase
MTEPNWAELWRELTERVRRPEREGEGVERARSERPDTLLDLVVEKLRPAGTVLDIGAGTGRFAIPFARVARTVTAVEPSASRARLLRVNAAAQGLANIRLVGARWEDAGVEPHDVAFCSHAMYTSDDLVKFVRKMEANARDFCFLVMRMPSHDGVMRELSRLVHGQPHDSPNFWVGYNVLYDMGIYANVVMEPFVRPWTDDSLDHALHRARRHLGLEGSTAWDEPIREILARRLALKQGRYYWPDGMRSAMTWWQPQRSGGRRQH